MSKTSASALVAVVSATAVAAALGLPSSASSLMSRSQDAWAHYVASHEAGQAGGGRSRPDSGFTGEYMDGLPVYRLPSLNVIAKRDVELRRMGEEDLASASAVGSADTTPISR